MFQRCFTPESARRALSRLRPFAERICRLFGELESRCPPRIRCDERVDPAYLQRLEALQLSLRELTRSGVQVRDLRRGMITFPARRQGRFVLLCWQVGEPCLSFWHELGGDPSCRRPVDEDGPWEDPVAV